MDFNYHAPTVAFPVPNTLMIEPTESESKHELDKFADAMITIKKEIEDIIAQKYDKVNNPLKNAPHTAEMLASENWSFPYSREKAVFPKPWVKENKVFPSVARIDNAYGDRNLICTCPPVSEYEEQLIQH
jgi:glycine dehydrogenase